MQADHSREIREIRQKHQKEIADKEARHKQETSFLKTVTAKAAAWFPYLREMLRIENLCRLVGFDERQAATLVKGKPLEYAGVLYSEEHGRKFTIYSIDRRNISCDLTYVEEGGVICHPENDGLFDDEGPYSVQWGEIIISSAVMPEKYHFTIYPNTTDKERKIRFGFNCFRYDCRIVSVIQPAGAVKQNDESGH